MTRMREHQWLSCLPRQNQQYWYAGFRLQAVRFAIAPDIAAVHTVLSHGFVPVSHSLDCAILRL